MIEPRQAPTPTPPTAPAIAEPPTECCGLHQLEVGCVGCVHSVGGDRELRRRLLEMGFCNGAQVELIRRAPLGDPIEFSLRGYCVSLRSEQARHVKVAP